jgi:hypothetical protein
MITQRVAQSSLHGQFLCLVEFSRIWPVDFLSEAREISPRADRRGIDRIRAAHTLIPM